MRSSSCVLGLEVAAASFTYELVCHVAACVWVSMFAIWNLVFVQLFVEFGICPTLCLLLGMSVLFIIYLPVLFIPDRPYKILLVCRWGPCPSPTPRLACAFYLFIYWLAPHSSPYLKYLCGGGVPSSHPSLGL